jgi:hypothetical protein
MGEITSITPQIKDKRRCNIFIDGKFYCGMLLETTVKHRLKVGRSVTEEELSTIQLDSEKQTALDKALTHITASKKTEKTQRSLWKWVYPIITSTLHFPPVKNWKCRK